MDKQARPISLLTNLCMTLSVESIIISRTVPACHIMETKEDIQTLVAKSLEEWRDWLNTNCQKQKSVYLIIYHKHSKTQSVHWHEAIENALCFGWVDSKAVKRDKESCFLKFTPRNPKSQWGKKNRERAIKMIEKGLMTQYGQTLIDIAKTTGKWGSM